MSTKIEEQRGRVERGEITLWHHAASIADMLAALSGEAYTAMCGLRCHGRKGVVKNVAEVPRMERCAMCAVEAGAG